VINGHLALPAPFCSAHGCLMTSFALNAAALRLRWRRNKSSVNETSFFLRVDDQCRVSYVQISHFTSEDVHSNTTLYVKKS